MHDGEYYPCLNCPRIASIICDRELLGEDDPQNMTKWLQWTKIETTQPDGQKKDKWDFVSVETPIQVVLAEMRRHWSFFLVHHFDSKWAPIQNMIQHKLRCHAVASVQDFSMNNDLTDKDEHVSRFFNKISYALYGLIAFFDAHNLRDEVFAGVQCKWNDTLAL